MGMSKTPRAGVHFSLPKQGAALAMTGGIYNNGSENGNGCRPEPRAPVDKPYEDFARKNADWDRRVRESVEKLTESDVSRTPSR